MAMKPETKSERLGRRLSLVTSTLLLTYYAAIAYLCSYLPADPFYLSIGLTGYAWYSCALSSLGLLGALNRRFTLLTIFSHHLLIDTLLSLIPKLGVLFLITDLTHDVCMDSFPLLWRPEPLPGPLHNTAGFRNSRVGGGGGGSVDAQVAQARREMDQCEMSLVFAQLGFVLVFALWTAAQWSLGMSVRRYAMRLEAEREGTKENGADVEKGVVLVRYEDEKGRRDEIESVGVFVVGDGDGLRNAGSTARAEDVGGEDTRRFQE